MLRQIHLNYWRQRTRSPTWARDIVRQEGRVSIDAIVNANGNVDGTVIAAHNLLNILRNVRRREHSLCAALVRMAADPGTIYNPRRRAAYCRRWLRRIRPQEQP